MAKFQHRKGINYVALKQSIFGKRSFLRPRFESRTDLAWEFWDPETCAKVPTHNFWFQGGGARKRTPPIPGTLSHIWKA